MCGVNLGFLKSISIGQDDNDSRNCNFLVFSVDHSRKRALNIRLIEEREPPDVHIDPTLRRCLRSRGELVVQSRAAG